MASVLGATRDFAANAIARLRSGLDRPETGPELQVEPFDSHNASTGAGLIKIATAIHAGRRAKSAFAEKQGDEQLARERVRAETDRISAEAERARRPETPAVNTDATTMEIPKPGGGVWPKGTSRRDIAAVRAAANDRQRVANHAKVEGRAGKLAAAKAAIGDIDEHTKRDIAYHTNRRLNNALPYLADLVSNPKSTVGQLYFQRQLGVDLSQFRPTDDDVKFGPGDPNNKQRRALAEQAIKEAIARAVKSNVDRNYASKRRPHEMLINELSGAQAEEPDQTEEEDPLNLFP